MENKIEIGNKVITSAIVAEMQKGYSKLKVENSDRLILDTAELSDSERENLILDLNFFIKNPTIALENLCCHLDNYKPLNDSQNELINYANRLANINDPSKKAGIWAYGSAGVGKSHVAISLAKEFMKRGMDSYFKFAKQLDHSDLRKLGPNQFWVIDDFNSGGESNSRLLLEIVLNAHNNGGKMFVTSNSTYNQILDELFPSWANQAEKKRFVDRTDGLFKVLQIEGESQRKKDAWYN